MSNSGHSNENVSGPDFYSFRFPARPSNNDPPETTFYAPSSRFAVGTFQTIYGSFNSRMRQVSDFEPVKHKRSRKGCYTCRARRVKCDEVRPSCQRCRKGKRTCVFPEAPPTSPETTTKSSPNETRSSGEPSASRDAASRDKSVEASSERDSRLSSVSSSDVDTIMSDDGSLFSKLRDDENAPHIRPQVRSHLDYFTSHVSHHHFGFMETDKGVYLRTQLSEHALRDDALMFAIVAFAAYLAMVSESNSSMEVFLGFYSSSMYMLRKSLQSNSGQRPSVTTLMTVLQLALLEEYLGDWVNLQAHKKAALRLITEMYTPDSMAEDELTSILLEWYMRFDQFTAYMSKTRSALGREWFDMNPELFVQNEFDDAKKLRLRAEWSQRLLGKDVSVFFGASGESNTDVETGFESLNSRFAQWTEEFEQALFQQAHVQTDLSENEPSPSLNLSNPTDDDDNPNDNVWPAKNLLVRFWTTELFFIQAVTVLLGRQPTQDMLAYSRKICHLLKDIDNNEPHPDAMLGVRAPLGLMSLVCRNDPEWATWCHDRLLAIESRGYLYPSAFHKLIPSPQSRDTTGTPTSQQDEQGKSTVTALPSDRRPPIIHAIREWIEERSTNQLDKQSENIRALAGIIGAIDVRGTAAE